MLPPYGVGEALGIYAIMGTLMTCLVLLISWLVRPMIKRKKAQEAYECGMPTIGESRAIGFSFIGYAVLFLLFDLAAIYLFLFTLAPMRSPQIILSFTAGLVTLSLIIVAGTRRRMFRAA